MVLREHDASNRVTGAKRRWKEETKLSCLGVLCGKTALENEVTAKCRKEGQKEKKKGKKKGRQGKKKMKKEKNWRKFGITNRFMEGGEGEYAGQPRALKKVALQSEGNITARDRGKQSFVLKRTVR